MKSILWKLSIFRVLVFAPASAQTFQGSLRGRVGDRNGAVTANAKLTLTDDGTQVARTTVTNGDGQYTFASLTPSTYTVAVEAAGFKKLAQSVVFAGNPTFTWMQDQNGNSRSPSAAPLCEPTTISWTASPSRIRSEILH
jgi:hypothetical protein